MTGARSLLALSLLITACSGESAAPTTEAILGGRPATPSDGLGTVALLVAETGDLDCSGTLVTPTVVVTAAHCVVVLNDAEDTIVRDVFPSELVVRVGALDITSGEAFEVVGVRHDPAFSPAGAVDADGLGDDHDIGVVILARPASGPTISLLSPADVEGALVDGAPLTIAGYGDTAATDGAPYGTLMVAVTSFLRHDDTELLAVGAPTHDTCFGDSGGPAMVDTDSGWRLAGITSRGATDAPCGAVSSVFTLASAYVDELSAWTGVSADVLAPPLGAAPPPTMPPPSAHDAGTHRTTYADAGAPTESDPSSSATPTPHHTRSGSCSIASGTSPGSLVVFLVLTALGLARRASRRPL